MSGTLYLIPTPISEEFALEIISPEIRKAVASIRHYALEDIRTARRFLKLIDKAIDIDNITFFNISKNLTPLDEQNIITALNNGNHVGVMSEAGVPCVADPGSNVVLAAHNANIKVEPLIGPSSILLALMGSGLNGQRFEFHGYLPVKSHERRKSIHNLEKDSALNIKTQIFIETPYRNTSMFQDILQVCQPATLLTVAIDLTGNNQVLKTMTIEDWRQDKLEFPKKPAIFALFVQK